MSCNSTCLFLFRFFDFLRFFCQDLCRYLQRRKSDVSFPETAEATKSIGVITTYVPDVLLSPLYPEGD